MAKYTLNENVKAAALKQVIKLLNDNPEKNISRIIHWVEVMDREGNMKAQIDTIKKAMEDQTNWYQLVLSLWRDVDTEVRAKMFENFVINANVIASGRIKDSKQKYDCNIPWAILMDPTSACNLQCQGCWAADYGNKLNMSYEELDDIVNQANRLGTFMFIFSGGEPLVRKKDIIRLCQEHDDCMFLAFTNGTLIDQEFCQEMRRVKNFIPAISVEGFEAATDSRRGAGTYQSVEKAMANLRAYQLPFGVSCCYTGQNYQDIGSEDYFDWMIDQGAKFAWFFTYMPVGVNAVPELMVNDQQRAFMYHKIRSYRQTKPIFTMDFWNDGEYVGGCIAGGRNYLHINANGDIEPCAFIHYSDSNIRQKTLLEALQSPLFMAYRAGQPFNQNHLRPCPLLDNKDRLAQMVDSCAAHSTDLEHPEEVHSLCAKCHQAADGWAPTAQQLWDQSQSDRQAPEILLKSS